MMRIRWSTRKRLQVLVSHIYDQEGCLVAVKDLPAQFLDGPLLTVADVAGLVEFGKGQTFGTWVGPGRRRIGDILPDVLKQRGDAVDCVRLTREGCGEAAYVILAERERKRQQRIAGSKEGA